MRKFTRVNFFVREEIIGTPAYLLRNKMRSYIENDRIDLLEVCRQERKDIFFQELANLIFHSLEINKIEAFEYLMGFMPDRKWYGKYYTIKVIYDIAINKNNIKALNIIAKYYPIELDAEYFYTFEKCNFKTYTYLLKNFSNKEI